MPQDNKPIKVVAIEWQKCGSSSEFIGGIRLVLSNGQKSPDFFARGESENKMLKCDIPYQVKRINGTDDKDLVCKINFFGAEKTQKSKIYASNSEVSDDLYLENNENIIGIYGIKEEFRGFY